MIMKAGHGGSSGRFQRMQEMAEVSLLSRIWAAGFQRSFVAGFCLCCVGYTVGMSPRSLKLQAPSSLISFVKSECSTAAC
jgi:hypothetical protein